MLVLSWLEVNVWCAKRHILQLADVQFEQIVTSLFHAAECPSHVYCRTTRSHILNAHIILSSSYKIIILLHLRYFIMLAIDLILTNLYSLVLSNPYRTNFGFVILYIKEACDFNLIWLQLTNTVLPWLSQCIVIAMCDVHQQAWTRGSTVAVPQSWKKIYRKNLF